MRRWLGKALWVGAVLAIFWYQDYRTDRKLAEFEEAFGVAYPADPRMQEAVHAFAVEEIDARGMDVVIAGVGMTSERNLLRVRNTPDQQRRAQAAEDEHIRARARLTQAIRAAGEMGIKLRPRS